MPVKVKGLSAIVQTLDGTIQQIIHYPGRIQGISDYRKHLRYPVDKNCQYLGVNN